MTTLEPSVAIRGDVESDEDLLIDTHVHGRIRGRHVQITIGPRGRIDGDIRALRVVVQGHVYGSVWAGERVTVTPTGVVHGAISSTRIVIDDGAMINARIDMDRRTIADRVSRYKAEHAGTLVWSPGG